MTTPSSPGSVSDGNSPRSSSTRPNTASSPSVVQTSPTRYTEFKQSRTRSMPPPNNFEVNGFLGVRSQNSQATVASQASTLTQQDNRDGTPRNDAQTDLGPMASWGRPLIVQENRQHADPAEDLPLKDWHELETRYERDMAAAIHHENSILDEIEWVMKACAC